MRSAVVPAALPTARPKLSLRTLVNSLSNGRTLLSRWAMKVTAPIIPIEPRMAVNTLDERKLPAPMPIP
jgi:hypothetical protein